jgi:hypothetical protein
VASILLADCSSFDFANATLRTNGRERGRSFYEVL